MSLAVGPVAAPRGLRGRLRVPGDKSIAHRALILGALAEGGQTVRGLPVAEDVGSTMSCLRELGCRLSPAAGGGLRIEAGRWRDGTRLWAGNSGTTARLLSGLIAAVGLSASLDGDQSLRRRPMSRVAAPLVLMGARAEVATGGGLPLRLGPGPAGLEGISYRLPVASAQIKSAILIAGLRAAGTTEILEPAPCRDHTEIMLAAMGAELEREPGRVALRGGQRLAGLQVRVPGDVSSATFFLVAASLVPGSEIVLEGVGINPTRTGALRALQAMGARIEVQPAEPGLSGGAAGGGAAAGEPVADLLVRSSSLRAIEIGAAQVPSLIDELPVLAVAATQAEGRTTVSGAAELRHKESDRIRAVVENLEGLGAVIRERPDGFEIDGPTRLRGGRVDAAGDHRIAMAMAVAGLVADGPVTIEGNEAVAISYPGFFADLASLSDGSRS